MQPERLSARESVAVALVVCGVLLTLAITFYLFKLLVAAFAAATA